MLVGGRGRGGTGWLAGGDAMVVVVDFRCRGLSEVEEEERRSGHSSTRIRSSDEKLQPDHDHAQHLYTPANHTEQLSKAVSESKSLT